MELSNLNGDSPSFLIDEMVAKALDTGPSTIAELLLALPGVYPSDAIAAVRRLVSEGIIQFPPFFQAVDHVHQVPMPHETGPWQSTLPIPHPLDYEWRFSIDTIDYLLKECQKLTRENDLIILLGAPTLLCAGLEQGYSRNLLLIDANPALAAQFAGRAEVIYCDLLTGVVPDLKAAAVLVDPPWYEEHMHSFLWAASRICHIGGHILFSQPPIGTRPGIEQERERLLKWARNLGLELKSVLEASLTYLSPPFEINSLKAEGLIGIPETWRRGDMFIFVRLHHHDVMKPIPTSNEDRWHEVILSDIRIRVLSSEERTFYDPRLISLIPGDVLPSVSRRDKRRSLAAVWTSGNRIFGCAGMAIFLKILKALAANTPPEAAIRTFLQRPLTSYERDVVLEAAAQATELVRREWNEYVGQTG